MEVLDNLNNPSENYGKRTVEDVLERGYRFDFGQNFNAAFQMLTIYWGPMLGWVLMIGVGQAIIAGALIGPDYIEFVEEIVRNPDSVVTDIKTFFQSLIWKGLLAILLIWLLISPFYYGCLLMFRDGDIARTTGPFSSIFEAYKQGRWPKILAISFLLYILINIWQFIPYLFFHDEFMRVMDIEAIIENTEAPAHSTGMGVTLFSWLMYIPMIFFSVIYMLAAPIMLFQDLGVWQSMEASRKIVMKHFWSFTGYYIVIGIIAYAGIIACCVGFLATYPLLMYAPFVIYKDIFITQAGDHASADENLIS